MRMIIAICDLLGQQCQLRQTQEQLASIEHMTFVLKKQFVLYVEDDSSIRYIQHKLLLIHYELLL